MDPASAAKLTPEIPRLHDVSTCRTCALEALWAAVRDQSNWRVGYNPAFTTACENLRKLEAA